MGVSELPTRTYPMFPSRILRHVTASLQPSRYLRWPARTTEPPLRTLRSPRPYIRKKQIEPRRSDNSLRARQGDRIAHGQRWSRAHDGGWARRWWSPVHVPRPGGAEWPILSSDGLHDGGPGRLQLAGPVVAPTNPGVFPNRMLAFADKLTAKFIGQPIASSAPRDVADQPERDRQEEREARWVDARGDAAERKHIRVHDLRAH